MSTRPPRRLSDDEDALWQGVTRSIEPLHRKPKPQREKTETERTVSPSGTRKGLSKAVPMMPTRPEPARLPALASLGRRAKHRLARGTDSIEGRLDLHGMTQAQAHAALSSFLHTAQSRGARNVLIITGKGGRDPDRGVLKRQVPMWLRLPEFRALVVGFEDAHVGHGGEGALYVRVRKSKE